MKTLIIDGREYVEFSCRECRSANMRRSPTRYYRDGVGVVRVFAVSPHNVPVEASRMKTATETTPLETATETTPRPSVGTGWYLRKWLVKIMGKV